MKKTTVSLALLTVLLMFGISLMAQNYGSKSTLPAAKAKTGEGISANKASKKSGVESVVIVYKTHFDIGYSETVQQVLHDYRTGMADRVIDAIDKNSSQPKDKQFVWTLSGWPMKQILWEGQEPERRKKLGKDNARFCPDFLHTGESVARPVFQGFDGPGKAHVEYFRTTKQVQILIGKVTADTQITSGIRTG